MTKFKALLKKDLQISKKTLMIPLWITAGFYLLILLITAVAYFSGDLNLNLGDIQGTPPSEMINYIANLAIMGFPGLISLIFIIILTQGALNENIKNNSELFHRSQPVSIWYQSASRYIVGIAGNWFVLFAISIFNFIIVAIILAVANKFIFTIAFAGMLQSVISFMKTGLIIGSITFFFSAVFKDKAFLQGLAIIVGVQFLFIILNALMQWHLPLPLSYLMKLINASTPTSIEPEIFSENVSYYINEVWKRILINWNTLLQIGVSGVLFVGATLIYKSREIK
ncbi:MAG: hypothetical protein P9M11_07145 [Candidatus Tenebribacter burtonii]|nr:hypothetical protein [Candidatus Tenebribacter burtonii]